MDRSNVFQLIQTETTSDFIGQRIQVETTTTHYCSVDSITSAEFFRAGQTGIRPEFKLTMFAGDYNGEKIAVLDARRYAIYRTYYSSNDTVELYLEAKAGV